MFSVTILDPSKLLKVALILIALTIPICIFSSKISELFLGKGPLEYLFAMQAVKYIELGKVK